MCYMGKIYDSYHAEYGVGIIKIFKALTVCYGKCCVCSILRHGISFYKEFFKIVDIACQ